MFLTFGIRTVDLKTSNCDQRKLLKEIQEMLNKASKDVKDISKMVKALVESKKAIKEDLSRLQEDLENMTKEELHSLDSMELEKQIKFQESTVVVASRDVDFCVKVDDDIHVHAALEVQSKEPTKKVMMIQESTMQEPIVVGVNEEHIVLVQSLCVQGNQSNIAMESLVVHGMGVVHPLAQYNFESFEFIAYEGTINMDHICCIKCDQMYLDILSKSGIRLSMNEYGSVTTLHFDGNVFNIMIGPMQESVIIYGMNINSTFHIDEFFSPSFKIAPIHDPTNVCNHVAFDGIDLLCCDGCL